MKAIAMTDFGSNNVFKTVDIEPPQIGDHDLLIEVLASSVNPIDIKLRQGAFPQLCPNMPAVLNSDVAGVVVETGRAVKNFSPGDEVFACAGGIAGIQGALAQHMAVPEKFVAKKPQKLSFTEAAALPLVALTAWEVIAKRALVSRDDKVLVIGGTGGVGHIAAQLAKLRGSEVTVTVGSEAKWGRIKDWGIDHYINYREESFEDALQRVNAPHGFNVVVDTVGDAMFQQAQSVIGPQGRLCSLVAAGTHDLTQAYIKSTRIDLINILLPIITGIGGDDRGMILTEIAQLVDSGQLHLLVDSHRFRFTEVAEAHAYMETKSHTGKIVLESNF
ncbi:zinc-binding dehydrogenase [Hahella ganghwensis]|uniref:zinc-binding dehydrogenase n=1 Tax=Hahella ganghwensis TaxID=286420 RepID=UPI00037303EC|nr:zinc-binding dehydrogenase [Hahella ganghwensis]